MNVSTPLSELSGVGEKTGQALKNAGLITVGDLITFYPRKYDDVSSHQTIASLKPGNVVVQGEVEDVSVRRVRRGMTITTAVIADKTSKLQAVWFNQPYRATQLTQGVTYTLSGVFEFKYNKYQITNPSVHKNEEVRSGNGVVPVYRTVRQVKKQLIASLIKQVRPLMTMLPEVLPDELVQRYKLISRAEALIKIHAPASQDDIVAAKHRLGFEELFYILLASQLNKQENTRLQGWHIPFHKEAVGKFVQQLPFQLTDSQRLAAWQIIQDFESSTPMNRLLQGDVGSGKTVVAGVAALQAARAGMQTVVMAPTEILASQHADTLHALLAPFDVSVALLTGSVKAKERTALYEAIQQGAVDVIIGTHAVIQQKVTYHKLGFVVIDEQHRFGVAQRQALLSKSQHMPHLLAMTATPIPRSLALTVYGELDVSVLRELPAGRKPIKTKLWAPTNTKALYDHVDEELHAGRQAYVICSLIDDNPDNDMKSVEAEYKRLKNSVFGHRRIGLLHGKMKATDKEAVMEQFARHEIDILVSTTVVEVGVDVPNATVMIIENADTFGLSQLHQLRGRVGRSSHQSYCYLVMSDSKKPSTRLQEIEQSNDGFHLAEVDLQLRGPGEIYGKSQHGALNLQIASLADTKLIALTQDAARWWIAADLKLTQYNEVAKEVQYYQRLTTLN